MYLEDLSASLYRCCKETKVLEVSALNLFVRGSQVGMHEKIPEQRLWSRLHFSIKINPNFEFIHAKSTIGNDVCEKYVTKDESVCSVTAIESDS